MSNRDSNQSKGWRTTQNCSVKTPKCQTLKKIIASDFAHNRKFSVVKRTVDILLVSTGTFFRIQVIRNMGYTFTPITCHLSLCMYTETPPSCRDVVLRWKGREKRPDHLEQLMCGDACVSYCPGAVCTPLTVYILLTEIKFSLKF